METESIQDLVLVTGIYKMPLFKNKTKQNNNFLFQCSRCEEGLSFITSEFLFEKNQPGMLIEEDQPPPSLMTSLETK